MSYKLENPGDPLNGRRDFRLFSIESGLWQYGTIELFRHKTRRP